MKLMFFLLVFFLHPLYAADKSTTNKILYIASYHQGHAWTDGTTTGILEVLNADDVDIKIHYMDTKRKRALKSKHKAALQAKKVIESYQPDLVIISDDNAVKYLLKPYFKNAELPFVFSGVNWDASIYGLPYKNTTGIIEVELIKPLVEQLLRYSKGKHIGYLAMNSLSSKKNIMWHQKLGKVNYHKVYYVNTFDEWKKKYLKLQYEVDIVIVGNPQGIDAWNKAEAIAFVEKNTVIPSGATAPGREDYTLLGYLRQPEEHGRWAATAALKILKGTTPTMIPIASNNEGKLVVNQFLAKKLAITFPSDLFKQATIIQKGCSKC